MPLPLQGSEEHNRWTELAAVAAEPNPFYEPGFVHASVEHLGVEPPLLLVAGDADGWTGCLPVVRRAGRLEGWRHVHRFLGTPLVRRDRIDEGVAGLVQAAGRSRVLLLHLIAADGPVRVALRRHSPTTVSVGSRAMLRRRDEEDYLADTMSPRHYRELRRQTRQLAERHGPVSAVEVPIGRASVAAFLAMEGAGWKGRSGSGLEAAGHGPFFRALCETFAAERRLQLVALRAGERDVALTCHLRGGDGIFAFKLAHDPEFAHYSPGVQLEARVPGLLHRDAQARWVDSCAAEHNQMINRLWPDRRYVEHLLVGAPTPTGRFARRSAAVAARWQTGRHT